MPLFYSSLVEFFSHLSTGVITWFRAFIHRPIVDLVFELGSVVIHVDDEDVQINGVLNLVPIHVNSMGSQLGNRERGKLVQITAHNSYYGSH